MAKLRFLKIVRSTRVFSRVSCEITNATRQTTMSTNAQRIQHGAEPIVLLAAIQNDLHAAKRDSQQARSQCVELAGFRICDVGRIIDVSQ